MLRNCKGNTIIEMLAALSIWLTAVSLLIPNFMHIRMERKNMEWIKTAYEILTEEIERFPNSSNLSRIEKAGRSFMIYREKLNDGDLWKICVTWEHLNGKEEERCLYDHNGQ
jgi:competence protein ComGE